MKSAVRPPETHADDPVPTWLLTPLSVAVGSELLLLRLFTRVAIHLPGRVRASMVYGALSGMGRYAYSVATVLLVCLLVTLAWQHGRTAGWVNAGVAGAVAAFLAAAAAARVGVLDDFALASVVTGSVLLLAGLAARGRTIGQRVTLGAFGAAFTLAAVHSLRATASVSGRPSGPASGWLLFSAEVLAVVGALTAFTLTGARLNRAAVISGLFTGIAAAAFFATSNATAKILLLWTFGLAGYLPSPLYALAATVLVSGVVAALRTGDAAPAMAVLLIAGGGIGLHSTYQSGLVIAGLALLTHPLEGGGTGGLVAAHQLRRRLDGPTGSSSAMVPNDKAVKPGHPGRCGLEG